MKDVSKLEKETDLDSKLTKINDNVEYVFNGYLMEKRELPVTLTVKDAEITDTPKNIVAS